MQNTKQNIPDDENSNRKFQRERERDTDLEREREKFGTQNLLFFFFFLIFSDFVKKEREFYIFTEVLVTHHMHKVSKHQSLKLV